MVHDWQTSRNTLKKKKKEIYFCLYFLIRPADKSNMSL